MTPKEMMKMRLDGATFQEIADSCGTTRQAVHEAITTYAKSKFVECKRGRQFNCNQIKFEGIYEYFLENEETTLTSFANSVFGVSGGNKIGVLKKFFIGETEAHLTVSQIKRICEICEKPFEEVFKEREKKQ